MQTLQFKLFFFNILLYPNNEKIKRSCILKYLDTGSDYAKIICQFMDKKTRYLACIFIHSIKFKKV